MADEYLAARLSAKPIEDRQPRKGRQKHPTHRWVSVAAAYELKSPDHIEATSSVLGEDGKWVQVMMAQIKQNKGACDGRFAERPRSDAFPATTSSGESVGVVHPR